MSHTKEPWIIVPGGRLDPEVIITTQHRLDGRKAEICGMDVEFTGHHGDEQKANTRRIVACVNACAGIPTDDLDQCPSGGLFHLADMANEVVKQRDELLVALGRVIENVDEGDGEAPGHSHYKKGYWDKDGSKCEWCEDWNNAKALIASVKGGAA